MTDSDPYIPPPPPYELSLQHDQKVDIQPLDSEVSKWNPFRDQEKDSKRSSVFPDKFPTDAAGHTVPKCSTRSANGNPRTARPLPPSPADTRSPSSRGKVGSVAEIKSYVTQNNNETEPHAPVAPPFSAVGHSRDETSYTQSMLHPSSSAHSTPSHHPTQPSYNTPRHGRDDRWRASALSPMESESSFRRSSHMSSLSPSYSLPQNDSFRTRLSFDPFVAYSDSQASSRAALPVQRGMGASLYRYGV
ncbi:hypothetical protein V8E55_001670 [Tylopilus felleus]